MMHAIDPDLLTLVFGPGPGDAPETRAKKSSRLFVRGLDQLSFDTPRARGRRLLASEALGAYGFDALAEVALEGSSLICESADAVGRALKIRREHLKLSTKTLARRADLSVSKIEAMEASRRMPIREYEQVARQLGLDERMISYRAEPRGNDGVAVRLRCLSDDAPSLPEATVAALAEAAWVASSQVRLEDELGLHRPEQRFEPSDDFGSWQSPAFQAGYLLADQLRAALALGDDPIPSMRALAEERLCTPIIQTNLNEHVAGATLEVCGRRAIVLNLVGRNANVFVRRATLAHELCHLLFDPSQSLRQLRVDDYRELEQRPDQITDRVEQRANAFAVQLLAPQSAALRLYETAPSTDAFGEVIQRFGISFTAGRYQIWNGLKRRTPLESIDSDQTRPSPEWVARESYTTDYHPLRALLEHPARAGRFSAVTLRGAERELISWDTAAEWLCCTELELRKAAPSIRGLYPQVFDD